MASRFILTLVLLLIAQPIFANDTYKFESAIVELTGILVEKEYYGPPNYGENPQTDSKERAAVLQLAKSIKVIATKEEKFNETRDNVKELQLINVNKVPLVSYFEKTVKITGKLTSSITGHHHTSVLVEVDNIQLIK